jgi:hypothetical protein
MSQTFNELLILCGGDVGFYHKELETFPAPSVPNRPSVRPSYIQPQLLVLKCSFRQHDFSLSQKGKHIKWSDISDLIHVTLNVLSPHPPTPSTSPLSNRWTLNRLLEERPSSHLSTVYRHKKAPREPA